MEMVTTGMIPTVAEADLVASACEVAVTVTIAGFGATAGATYSPAGAMLPQERPEQPNPVTLQVTAVLVLPVTVAENCC